MYTFKLRITLCHATLCDDSATLCHATPCDSATLCHATPCDSATSVLLADDMSVVIFILRMVDVITTCDALALRYMDMLTVTYILSN